MTTLVASLLIGRIINGDPVTITQHYKVGPALAYEMKLDADANGQAIKLNADFTFKVNKLLEGGKVAGEIEVKKMTMDVNGNAHDVSMPPDNHEYDVFGMPDTLKFEEAEAAIALFSLSSFVPAKALSPGDTFKIDWLAKDKSIAVRGTGKFVGLSLVDGKSIATFKNEVDIKPENDTEGHAIIKALVDAETGQLVSSEIELTVEEVKAKGTISRSKK